jgi:hypothetical protein
MLDHFDPSQIQDETLRQQVIGLVNLLEKALTENRQLKEDVAALKDEIIRLKGGQGRPPLPLAGGKNKAKKDDPLAEFKKSQPSTSAPSSSDKDRSRKDAKNVKLTVDRVETLEVDKATLPKDAQFKGYEEVLVQDVKFEATTILFRKAKYYSLSQRMTYTAPLPSGYCGQFGPGVKAWVLNLYYAANMSEPKLLEFLHAAGLRVSRGQLSNWLIHDQELFHQEKAELVRAGLESSPYQQLDSTATGLFGQTYQCHVLCNPLYTAYSTFQTKDRQALLKVLLGGQPLRYRLTSSVLAGLEEVGVAAKIRAKLCLLPLDEDWNEAEFEAKLAKVLPKLKESRAKKIKELMALASYKCRVDYPVVELLMTDDAPQFEGLTREQALCWLHEIRHYKKLRPQTGYATKRYGEFFDKFWKFYEDLLNYRLSPSSKEARQLSSRFDSLFKGETGYAQLDERKLLTFAKKARLLAVLEHPELLLHNNPAELGVRQRVRKRDVSLQACKMTGLRAWDTFQSLIETSKKLGVNSYAYFYDRVSGKLSLPSLASLIRQKGAELKLNASWIKPNPALAATL